jgi:hypothetical protein
MLCRRYPRLFPTSEPKNQSNTRHLHLIQEQATRMPVKFCPRPVHHVQRAQPVPNILCNHRESELTYGRMSGNSTDSSRASARGVSPMDRTDRERSEFSGGDVRWCRWMDVAGSVTGRGDRQTVLRQKRMWWLPSVCGQISAWGTGSEFCSLTSVIWIPSPRLTRTSVF